MTLLSIFKPFRLILRRCGFDLVKYPATEASPVDVGDAMLDILTVERPHTLTSLHRLASTQDAVRYVSRAGVHGAIVECGVWRGGNMAVAARTLLNLGDTERDLFLYDTFNGMTTPTPEDADYGGQSAKVLLDQTTKGEGVWCAASINDVSAVMAATQYPKQRVHLVKGPVEETIPTMLPDRISVLRLDTDWYSSTLHELIHLFPKLEPGGVLIIDDYGHWKGARQAVDEYFREHNISQLLIRVDYTCRVMIKPM